MTANNWWYERQIAELMESLLPDFILAFAFFTSIAYAMLGKRFESQRPAIAMSTAMGLALSVGLVWWERINGFSIKDLGPIAIGFAVLVLAFVMYQSIRQIGGSWAGAGITIGVSILIAKVLKLPIPLDAEVIQTTIAVALLVGVIFLFGKHDRSSSSIKTVRHHMKTEIPSQTELYRDRHISENLTKGLRDLGKKNKESNGRPEEVQDVVTQIKKMLPVQGYLTERVAQLRARAHQVRNGHIARLTETRKDFAGLPATAKKRAAANLAARYAQLIGIDTRLERLDKAVAETELRIRQLTQEAMQQAKGYNHQGLYHTLKQAERLQSHNSKLFKIIEKTEHVLTDLVHKVTQEVRQFEKKQ